MKKTALILALPGIIGASAQAQLTVTDQGLTTPSGYETGQLVMDNRFGFDDNEDFGQTFTLPQNITLGSIWVGYNGFVDRSGTYDIEVDAGDDGTVDLAVTNVVLDGANFSGATTDGNGGPHYWMEWDLSSYNLALPAGMSSYHIYCTAEGPPGAATWVFAPCYKLGGDLYAGGAATGVPAAAGNDMGFAILAATGGPGTQYCPGDGIVPHTGCPCANNNNGSMGGCDWGNLAFPEGGVLTAGGSASMAANDTFLVATGIENNFGIFFGAANQVNGGNGNPLNDGLRCAGGGLVRLIPPTMASGNQMTLPAPVQTLDSGAASGVTRRYQYWFRTPGGPCGLTANLTNGYEIVWMP